LGLNIECRKRVAQNGLPPAQFLALEFDDPLRSPLFQQNGGNQCREGADAPAIDPEGAATLPKTARGATTNP